MLVVALGAGATACGSDGHPLSAKPYDAASQIAFNGPAGSQKADPDKPLEITAEGDEGRITDVTATDAMGRYVAGELTADGSRWHSTAPLAAGADYTVYGRVLAPNGADNSFTVQVDNGPKLAWHIAAMMNGTICNVNGQIIFFCQNSQPTNMVGMLVGNQDAGQVFRCSAQRQQAVANLPGAQLRRLEPQPAQLFGDVEHADREPVLHATQPIEPADRHAAHRSFSFDAKIERGDHAAVEIEDVARTTVTSQMALS